MILLDTSVLVDSLSGASASGAELRSVIESGERIVIPSLVLYEWLRGPRVQEELIAQEILFPTERSLTFGAREAAVSARLYRKLRRPRGREIDIAIAACAIVNDALLWTLNSADFADIPDLRLYRP